ncbi:hypothetical protein JW887_01350 [Candidatus Dojkabacteria bacterium]|nr:hypothetical protein [Candidatus Dojkabacteria bacterium]
MDSELFFSNIVLFITACYHIVITIFVQKSPQKNKRKLSIRYFSTLSLALAGWVVSNIMIDSVNNYTAAIIWTKLSGISIALTSLGFLLFSVSFPKETPVPKWLKAFGIAITFCSITVMAFTNLIVKDINMEIIPREVSYNFVYKYFVISCLLFITYGLWIFIRKLFDNEPEYNNQKRYVLWGFGGTLFFALLFNMILPNLGIREFTRLGPAFTLIFSIAMTTAILRHRLFSIKFLIAPIIHNFMLSAYILLSYIIITLIQQFVWDNVLSPQALIVGFLWAILFGISYPKVDTFIRVKFTDKIVDFNTGVLIGVLKKKIDTELNTLNILNFFKKYISYTLNIPKFYLLLTEKNALISSTELKLEQVPRNITDIKLDFDTYANKVISCSTIQDKNNDQKIFCKDNCVEAVIPIKGIKKKVGLILLTAKKDRSPYFQEDINLLESAAQVLGVAIERSLLYEEVQNFTQTLQKKVDEATLELKHRNTELQVLNKNLEELYQKEKDLMDIAGHEFRTPASVIKTNLYLLNNHLNKKYQTESDEKIVKYMERLSSSIEREISLINTFLESARIQNKRFELNIEQNVDFTEIIHHSVEDTKQITEKKHLQIIYNPPLKKIFADMDSIRIREVIDNLLSNAIKYTKEGYVEVKVLEREDFVGASIKDTGIGISQEDQELLFKKFSRIKNYIGGKNGQIVRPGGTGLGLFVAKNILSAHKDTITIESEVGKGSTFTFWIPKVQNVHGITSAINVSSFIPGKTESL